MAAMIIAALVLLTAGAGAFYLLNPSAPPSPAAPVQAAPSPPAAPGPALPKKATTLHPKVALAATLGRTAAGMARLAKLQAGIAAEDAEAIAAKARTVATAARDAARLGSEAAAKACLRGPVEGLACKTLPDGSTEAGEQSCDGNACVWNGHVSVSTGAYVFDGVMENGKFKLGTMLIEDGSRYSGEFEDRAPNGLGRMRLNDGVEMIGAFAHGSLEGLGRLEFPSTDATRISYAGMFHDGQKSGPGVFAWRNGETSSGIFDRDALTGYAVEEDSDQRTEGRYQDWFATIGVSHYADGTRYEGAFGTQPAPNDEKVTAREGPGVLFAADGTILRQGIWRNDRLSEPLQ